VSEREREQRDEREKNLLQHAREADIVNKRALYFARRFRPVARVDDLLELGNFALAGVVREFQTELGAFLDFCKQRVDRAMLDGIRVEARHQRLEWAARRALADLLATFRSKPDLGPRDRMDRLADNVAAATFAVVTEEAQHGGEDELSVREEYVTAHAVLKSVLVALPTQQKRLFVLLYVDHRTQDHAAEQLRVHVNTIRRWQEKVHEEIRHQLQLKGITQRPGRGTGPRLVVLADLASDLETEGDEKKGPRR